MNFQGLAWAKTHQLTALVSRLRSQGTLDRLKWVRLQQWSEALWASPQIVAVTTKKRGMLRKSFHDRCLLTLASARGRKERRKRYRGKKKKKKKWDPLGCSLIALFQCCMFCLLSDWVKWLFLLAYLRVALQQPDTSSDSVLYLNLLDPFTSSPVVMQTASVPMLSQIRVFCGQNNLPFSSGRSLPF